MQNLICFFMLWKWEEKNGKYKPVFEICNQIHKVRTFQHMTFVLKYQFIYGFCVYI